jgi:hypothetical protein
VLEEYKRTSLSRPQGALLFIAPNTASAPLSLVEDCILEPVDKVLWMVLRTRREYQPGSIQFPSHVELALKANIAARGTVARALVILRCQRWLTVCQSAWHRNGRRKGLAYALHGSSLAVADTVYLDPHYGAFLQQSTLHRHPRVRAVARGVLETLPMNTLESVRHADSRYVQKLNLR